MSSVPATGLREGRAAGTAGTVRRTASGPRRLLTQEAKRQLQVELRVLVVGIDRERSAKRLGGEEEETKPLARIVRCGEREAHHSQEVRRLRASARLARRAREARE